MPLHPPPQVFHCEEGLVTDQISFGTGVPGSVKDGSNVFFDENGVARAFGGVTDKSESVSPSALAYTAQVFLGQTAIIGNASTFLTDFLPYQHVLIERRLYVVQTITNDTHMTVSPAIETANNAAAAIATVPVLHALVSDRGSLTSGVAVEFREEILLVAGKGKLKIDGANSVAAMTASSTMQIAYPDPANPGQYIVANNGFTKPAIPTAIAADSGSSPAATPTKQMSSGTYSVRVARGRKGFQGIGPFSEAVQVVLTTGQLIRLTLGAFDASQGQTMWVVAATQSPYTGSNLGGRGPWWLIGDGTNETTVQSGIFDFEFRDSEMVEEIGFDNDPPPPCLGTFVFNDRAYGYSCFGNPDVSGLPTTPGPAVIASKPNNYEAFSPAAAALVSPSEPIIGVRAGTLRVFALTANHLNVGSLTGSAETPLTFRAGQAAGFSHQYNGAVCDEVFFYFTGEGLGRTAGNDNEQGDFSFSSRVKSLLHGFMSERTFVGFDPKNKHVVAICSNYQLGTGGKWQSAALSYNIRTNNWNTLCLLGDGTSADFTVTGVASINSQLWFVTADGKTYLWDQGSATISGFLAFPFSDFGVRDTYKIARFFNLTANANGAVTIHRNNDLAGLSAGTGGVTRPFSGPGDGTATNQRVWKLNYKGKSFAVRVAFTALPARAPILEGADLTVEVITGRRG